MRYPQKNVQLYTKNLYLSPEIKNLSFLKVRILLFETNQQHQIMSFALKIA